MCPYQLFARNADRLVSVMQRNESLLSKFPQSTPVIARIRSATRGRGARTRTGERARGRDARSIRPIATDSTSPTVQKVAHSCDAAVFMTSDMCLVSLRRGSCAGRSLPAPDIPNLGPPCGMLTDLNQGPQSKRRSFPRAQPTGRPRDNDDNCVTHEPGSGVPTRRLPLPQLAWLPGASWDAGRSQIAAGTEFSTIGRCSPEVKSLSIRSAYPPIEPCR